jgi:hypothetical protein
MEKEVSKTKIVIWIFLGIFWLLGAYPFVTQEISSGIYNATWSYVSLLGETALMFLGFWLIRNKTDIFFLVSFVIIAFISNRINGDGYVVLLNGSRQYFSFLFVIPILRYLTATPDRTVYFIKTFEKHLYAFLCLQFPCMVIQCILYGAYDQVGGSLGWMMSGVISTTIYITSFYFMMRRWDSDASIGANIKKNWILIFLLIPSYLNETKVSFVFLLLYFIFIIPMYKRFFRMIVVVAPIMLAALGLVALVYSVVTKTGTEVFSKEYIELYTVGDDAAQDMVLDYYIASQGVDDVEGDDFARGLKFIATPVIMDDKPHAWLWGYGVGQFKGGTQTKMTSFAKKYHWLLQGTVMSGMMWLMELGILGCIWILLYFTYIFRLLQRVKKRELRLQWFMGFIFVIIVLYANNFTCVPFSIIYIFIAYTSSRWNIFKLLKEDEKKPPLLKS